MVTNDPHDWKFGTAVNTDFILGMGKVSQKVILLLDIDRVLTQEQMSVVERTGKEGSDDRNGNTHAGKPA